MRIVRLLPAAIASLWIASVAAAQVPADLRAAISGREKAVATTDAATWDRLTRPEFTVVGAAGRMLTKAERLAQFKQATPDSVAPPRNDEAIRLYGNTAIERYRTTSNWIMQVWIKGEQGWQVAAVQVTPAVK